MNYEKIPFLEVQKIIQRIFNNDSVDQLFLTPDSIHSFAEFSGIQLKWRPILNWTKFETTSFDYSEQDFLDIAFAKTHPCEGRTIIVTDECFKDKMAFSIFRFKDIIEFMEDSYPALFNMQFQQPSDFIFIQPDIDLITMIHHEGQRTKFSKS